jgi:16S rRNA processing protein RimM
VARVLGARGLSGGLRIELLTDWPERFAPGASVWIEGEEQPRQVAEMEWGGRIPVLHLVGVETREAADELVGRFLEGPPRALGEGEYYWHELVGLRVRTVGGEEVGSLTEVFRAGGAEVYRIEGAAGEVLIPALRSVVREIDLPSGVMVVDYQPEEVP